MHERGKGEGTALVDERRNREETALVDERRNIERTALVYEMHVFFCRTEWNLLSSLSKNFEKFCKLSADQLIFLLN